MSLQPRCEPDRERGDETWRDQVVEDSCGNGDPDRRVSARHGMLGGRTMVRQRDTEISMTTPTAVNARPAVPAITDTANGKA